MTPEEIAAAAAAAAAATPPAIDYTKFDYAKLGAEIAKIQATSAAADQRKKDAETATAAAADAQRVKDEAAAAAATAAGKTATKWVDPKDTPEFRKLQADFDARNAKDAEREKKAELKERSGTVKSALSDYAFQNDKAKASAIKSFIDEITLAEDGETYVGPDGSPAETYIAKMMDSEYDFLLLKKDVGGSGAHNGGSRKATAMDLDSIKPGMKPEAKAQAYAEIARLTQRS
jgi:hypothetical protein